MKFLADENFNNRIARGLLRRMPSLDILRVQDLAIAGSDDEVVLAWASDEGYVLLTHDARTVPQYALARLRNGHPLAGVVVIGSELPIGAVIEDLIVIATCSSEAEWFGRIEYLPL
jgi:predicted nuclease of predicted toxin-antitoxin system